MILQSIDHGRLFFTPLDREFESWYTLPKYNTTTLLLRIVSHPCAPGFAMLMGIGLVYFVRSRKALGWSDGRILYHSFVRGSILVAINIWQTWRRDISSGDETHGLFRLTVLHALGINYICSTAVLLWSLHLYMYLVRRLGRYDTSDTKIANQANVIQVSIILSLAFVFMVFNLLVVPLPVPEGIVPGYGWWRYLMYLPGTSQFFFSMYPSLTWLGMTIYGCALGLIMIKWKRSNSGYAKWNMVLSGGWVMLFPLVRAVGGFGNINPSLVGTDTSKSYPFLSSWNAFFNTIKYPPDLAFSSLFLAINHMYLSVFFLLPTEVNTTKFYMASLLDGPLMDFGRSALFFYVTHFLVFSNSADALGYFFPNLKNPNDHLDLNLWQFLLVWLALLCLLWWMCRLYARFKERQQPDSIFRFF
ncbi:hypothetical protein K450DRAFT_245472 [Umbelopsis ramanniana AG]|uniref:Uncharacterized protein n=1 Tax=Umbelopsis ramanniana AG TaxID=1314678 RepID=A0AAD5HE38_UMBRA|nr:uncharacterized protein K450DRAFT_245472 [Umbelopsis ramanniana AG]KAI8578778.1 hypothetical protein K450DRAFT_245472 [Umbelopsis ramanniana AG]